MAEVAELEQRLAALELRCEEYRMLEETADAIPFRMTTDLSRFLYVGPQAHRLLGIAKHEWLVPGFFERRLSAEDRAATLEQCRLVVEFGAAHEAEFRLRRDDGTWAWLRCALQVFESSAGATLAGHFFDITVRRSLEADVAQFQRLEAVGRLAAGIAHEINTPVQFINDNVTFAKDGVCDVLAILQSYREAAHMLPASESKRIAELEQTLDLEYLSGHIVEALESSSKGLATVATLVRSMKAFSHRDGQQREPANINEALLTTTVISTNEYRYVADIKTELGEIPPVRCHISELNQVFLNLIVNAAHAIGDAVRGTDARGVITIATRVDGSRVVVSITDTGTGIPEAVRGRIFDPFFTTKDIGKGTGQGLSIANTIVQKHGGALTFETEMGKGTTFFVTIPIAT